MSEDFNPKSIEEFVSKSREAGNDNFLCVSSGEHGAATFGSGEAVGLISAVAVSMVASGDFYKVIKTATMLADDELENRHIARELELKKS